MASKKSVPLGTLFFAIGLVLAVVVYIVRRDQDSGFARLVAAFGEMVEGFDAPSPSCPRGMKFFNDRKGASFCCGAEVNPIGATCSDPKKTCALEPTKGVSSCKS
jgi:hypothetical protein